MSDRPVKELAQRRNWLKTTAARTATATVARTVSAPGALRLALARSEFWRHWLTRRGLALPAGAGLASLAQPALAASVVGVRVWPANEYTRITLELDEPLEHSHFTISNPERVVVDIKGLTIDARVKDLISRVSPSDPHIRQVRIGQFDRETARFVFDVKQPIRPQLFTLDPVEQYRFRLVVDLYPTRPPDPLDVLIAQTEAASLMREFEQAMAESAGKTPPVEEARPTSRRGQPGKRPPPVVSRLVTIALDPGHGGEDPGAIGPKGTYEKDVVLAIAMRLRDRINREPNMRAFLTRDGDYYVPLEARVSRARAVNADLFISIHADAAHRREARGSSVFVLSDRGATSVEARWLASRENRADQIGGVSLKTRNREAAQVLMRLITQTQIRDSKRLATHVLSELGDLGNLHKAQVEQASFAVLKAPDIPSVLVETAFISNPDEERRLRDPKFQDGMANAMMNGIRNFFIKNPPGPRGTRT